MQLKCMPTCVLLFCFVMLLILSTFDYSLSCRAAFEWMAQTLEALRQKPCIINIRTKSSSLFQQSKNTINILCNECEQSQVGTLFIKICLPFYPVVKIGKVSCNYIESKICQQQCLLSPRINK